MRTPSSQKSSRGTRRSARWPVAVLAAGLLTSTATAVSASTDTTEPTTDATSGAKADRSATESSEPTGAQTEAVPADVATTMAGPTSGAIGSYREAQPAVVQIVATGSFRDPQEGNMSGTGSGSGFIISPDGYAVTNNHVVAGAATLDVFIGGDDTAHNARILGTSECNDLALIKIEGLSDSPYFEWYTDELEVGIDVYAAGFPLGDPEYTLTRGIVSKVEADGNVTSSASVDHTLEHDAAIQHGSSGGPLIAADGRVVGVNYAGGISAPDQLTAQYYAIAADLAEPVIETLEEGDFESLGLNAYAVTSEDGSAFGVWVAGVDPGTGASQAGLLPGDVIETMNGVAVGENQSMEVYCDVMRTVGQDGAIGVQVFRPDTGEVLRGEINGSSALTVTETVGTQPPNEQPVSSVPDDSVVPAYDGAFDTVQDETGLLTVDLPTTWTERGLAPQTVGDAQVAGITAAANLQNYVNGYDEPGVTLLALPFTADIDGTLARTTFADCTAETPEAYSDAVFTGKSQWYDNCGGTQTDIVVLVVNPSTSSATIQMVFQWTGPEDQAILDRIVGTFNVTR